MERGQHASCPTPAGFIIAGGFTITGGGPRAAQPGGKGGPRGGTRTGEVSSTVGQFQQLQCQAFDSASQRWRHLVDVPGVDFSGFPSNLFGTVGLKMRRLRGPPISPAPPRKAWVDTKQKPWSLAGAFSCRRASIAPSNLADRGSWLVMPPATATAGLTARKRLTVTLAVGAHWQLDFLP